VTCSMQMLLGSGSGSITLAPGGYGPSSNTTSPTNAGCTFELTNGGDIRETTGSNVINDVGDWVTPKTNFSAYDCMLTVNSGTAPAGAATATWLNLGTTRTWTLTQSVVGSKSNSCTLQIRNSASGTVLGSCNVSMSADVS
jgi:hypothetical protein